jgi:hypothetical protein
MSTLYISRVLTTYIRCGASSRERPYSWGGSLWAKAFSASLNVSDGSASKMKITMAKEK